MPPALLRYISDLPDQQNGLFRRERKWSFSPRKTEPEKFAQHLE